jgi:protein-S-isoprenylcysteine O-methyltransferase Ste14
MSAVPGLPRAPLVAWLGGAAFVLSLAVFALTFYSRMSQPNGPTTATVPLLLDMLLFGTFALHHSVLARTGIKRWITARLSPRYERTAYVWVASLLFIVVCVCWQPLAGRLYVHTGLTAVPHWLAVAAGVWLTARGAAVIDPLDLAGIRQAAGERLEPVFKVMGPYRLVRHPIYLGWLLMVFGAPDMTATRFAFAVISSAYLVVAIPFEERTLVETFPDAYPAYQRQVRWRMLPGLW